MKVTAYEVAARFLGLKEIAGPKHRAAIVAMLELDGGTFGDETPWCSAFANYVCWLLGLPRSKSLAARSWLKVGRPASLEEARLGFCVVVLKRGGGNQPGPEVLQAPGHVAFFDRVEGDKVFCLGGNQSDAVTIAPYPISQVLGVRDLAPNTNGGSK